MKKVLFLTGNGLGDSVMLTPALSKYQKENPDTEIHIATLKRFGKAPIDLFAGLEYGYNVHPILSDPWEIKFDDGLLRVVAEGNAFAKTIGADVKLCHSPRGHTDWKMHKIYRFAEYLGVTLEGDEFQTELGLDVCSFADAISMGDLNKHVVVHVTPGNEAKSISKNMMEFVKSYCNQRASEGATIIEIGSNHLEYSVKVGLNNMSLTKALVSSAREVIAIDSVVMHIAGAFKKKLISLWTVTPVHQALPFWLPLEDLVVYYENEGQTQGGKWKIHREKALKELGC